MDRVEDRIPTDRQMKRAKVTGLWPASTCIVTHRIAGQVIESKGTVDWLGKKKVRVRMQFSDGTSRKRWWEYSDVRPA